MAGEWGSDYVANRIRVMRRCGYDGNRPARIDVLGNDYRSATIYLASDSSFVQRACGKEAQTTEDPRDGEVSHRGRKA